MEQIILKSDRLTASVSLTGMEITRLTRADGTDLLWEGLPAVWGHVSPLLFPFPGTLRGGFYLHGGRKYVLPNGGFAQERDFSVLHRSAHQLIAETLMPTPEYPFEARLLVAYTLRGAKLLMEYNLVNSGFSPLYYGLGRQFAIACPEGVSFQRIVMDTPRDVRVLRTEGPYISGVTEELGRGLRQFSLGGSTLQNGALFLENPGAVSLLSTKTGRQIRMDMDGFSYLRIWHRPRGGFLSLEPWTTLPDRADSEQLLSRKEGMEMLPPGKTRQYKQIFTLIE